MKTIATQAHRHDAPIKRRIRRQFVAMTCRQADLRYRRHCCNASAGARSRKAFMSEFDSLKQ
jgi:hypothetical protein